MIACVETDSLQEHAAVLSSNADDGWELVTLYETDEDWRFIFKRVDERGLS